MDSTQEFDLNWFFRETTLRISSSLDPGKALVSLCQFLQDYLPFDFAGMYYLTQADMQDIYGLAQFSLKEGLMDHNEHKPIGQISRAMIQRLEEIHGVTPGKPSIKNDPDKFPEELVQYFEELRGCSHLIMDLNIQDEDIGTILFSKKGPGVYQPPHADLLESIHDPVAIAVSNARRFQEMKRLKDRLAEENRVMHREMEQISGNRVIGADFGLSGVMEMVRQVAPMNSPVLLTGETGAGKEVIANAIHIESPRREGPIIRVQCGAIPDSLLDSELFGHEKGAFTGAIQAKRGRFERAHTGTIFLDEIGELTLEAQVKLLRVLQEKEFERLGGSKTIEVDVRVIVATHRNLRRMVEEGSFREDLWFRLNVFPIHIPPLRHRKEDIASLAQYFIDRKCREMNLGRRPVIQPEELERLVKYDWPGNVRELQNIIERALILGDGNRLRLPAMGISRVSSDEISEYGSVGLPVYSGDQSLDAITRAHISQTLKKSNGRIEGSGGAAEILQMHPSTLRARLRKLGMAFGRGGY